MFGFGSVVKIAFGTDGWRADTRKEFTDKNVARAVEGIAQYLKSTNQHGKVLVGYDKRPNSDKFAETASVILQNHGFDVYVADDAVPTPVLSFSVAKQGAVCGVEITASHNPLNYNGIKFQPGNGAPAAKEVTSAIEAKIPEKPPKPHAFPKRPVNLKEDYLKALDDKVDLSRAVGMHIIIDTMYGTSTGYLTQLLTTHGGNVEELHNVRDSNAEKLQPNPTVDNLSELINAVVEKKADLGIANDGDADRIAAVDSAGKYYPANLLSLIITEYLFKFKGVHGPIARTVSTTSALDRLAASYNVPVVETPVGFKHLANEMDKGAVIGVEQSGGIGYDWWIPNKDGIASAAILCEAVANQGKPLSQLAQEAAQAYGYHEYIEYSIPKEQKARESLEFLQKDIAREMFGGRKITERNDLDGIKLYLEGGSWVLIRESHTEPLIRIYVESQTKREQEELIGATNRFFGEQLGYKP